MSDELLSLRAERDLYARLLELHRVEDLESALRQALASIVAATGAQRGYLEVLAGDETRWWIGQGFEDEQIALVRRFISMGILGEALATGQTVQTQSALFDMRFAQRTSVRENRIAAVICAPIAGEALSGVLYVQGVAGEGGFKEGDKELVEVFARELTSLLDRLGQREDRLRKDDPTQPWRERLEVEELVGRSDGLARVLRGVALAAPIPATVLITGPTGTGKTQLARAIHENGPRSSGTFLELNCAAIPDDLLESELFGALPGGHSTATQRMIGKVEAAHGGTLFLDEVGELSMAAQSKLLSFLESGRFYPLGSSKPEKSDCRIIAATNRDLEAAKADGTFREDLYYRLDVLTIEMPPLSARREDVVPLARHFCKAVTARYGFGPMLLSPGAEAALADADWPGNVRQLAHAVERAVLGAASEESDTIGVVHLFPNDAVTSGEFESPMTWQEAVRRAKRKILREAIEAEEGNVAAVARRLDLARSQVYKLREGLGV